MNQLTSDQLTKVKEQFCINLVNNMDSDTLRGIVSEQLMQSYDDWDEVEFKEEVINYYYDDEVYDDIVNTVTNNLRCGTPHGLTPPYPSYGEYVTTNPETNTDYGVGK